MTTAHLSITHAGPQVSIQDQGRPGLMRYGVPASGPMDRFAFHVANAALGNPPNTPAIEVSLGGLTLHCTEGPISFAIAGGGFQVLLNDQPLASWCISTLHAGQTLTLRPGRWGSWCYLAFAGQLQSNRWLGSAATHGPSGLGGGKLVTGGSLHIDHAKARPDKHATIPCPVSSRPRRNIRIVLGPQDRFFGHQIIDALLTNPFTLTDAYDRMGVRLAGPPLHPEARLDMPSEAILRGAVQVAGDGVATVLLADHQTTGGYPKIATILAADLDGFAQLRSRYNFVFQSITPLAAVSAQRTRHYTQATYLARWQTIN
jgi:5-oxoprolinase (ATP-hydrolysing) subunit C